MSERFPSTAELFAHSVAAVALGTAFEIGLLAQLAREGQISIAAVVRSCSLHSDGLKAVVTALVQVGVLTQDADAIAAGPRFDEALRDQSYFYWLHAGYGPLLSAAPQVLRGLARPMRNGVAISHAATEYGALFVDPIVARTLARLQFTKIADLGCGTAARLRELCRNDPAVHALGIDIDAETIEEASKLAAREGLADRVALLCCDVEQLPDDARLIDVEILLCFFMGHDLWPRERCLAVLQRLLHRFQNVRHLLLADTFADAGELASMTIFTPGFEFVHALLGKVIPTRDDWYSLFGDAGWDCLETIELRIPRSALFHLGPSVRRLERRRYYPDLPYTISTELRDAPLHLLHPREQEALPKADKEAIRTCAIEPAPEWLRECGPWLGFLPARADSHEGLPEWIVAGVCLPGTDEIDEWESWQRSPTLEVVCAVDTAWQACVRTRARLRILILDQELLRDAEISGHPQQWVTQLADAVALFFESRYAGLAAITRTTDPAVSAEVAAFKGLARQFPKGVSKPWGRPSRFWEQADFHGNVALFSLDARRGHRTLLVLDHDQFRAAFTARMLCEQVAIALYWPAPGGNWCCERIHQRDPERHFRYHIPGDARRSHELHDGRDDDFGSERKLP